jgi:predicted nucleic acid-binding protein
VKVVADSSPLIVLAKLNLFDLLPKLYPHVYISAEVYAEVIVAGAGLPGAAHVASAGWIRSRADPESRVIVLAEAKFGIGAGELSAIILARELKAELALVDWTPRTASPSRHLPDLRSAFHGCINIVDTCQF